MVHVDKVYDLSTRDVQTIQILSDSIRFGFKFLFESELFENFEFKYNII